MNVINSLSRLWSYNLSILCLILGTFFSTDIKSQVANYTFTQSTGTYTAITGGTNYSGFTTWTNAAYTGTLPNTTNGFLDDNVSAALQNIGFNFVYNGVTYTQFGICTNGWISLGTLPTNSSFPISLGTSNNIISALGGDLIGRGSLLANRTAGSAIITITGGNINQISVGDKVSGTGIPAGATVLSKTATTVTISANATTTGTGFHFRFSNPNFGIRFQTIGTAPNRTLVVQWTGWQRYTTTGVFGELYNFQIRLNETTNTINTVYSFSGPSSATATTFEIGLRGSANSDFNNRTSTTTWSGSTAGTLNSSTMTLSSTVTPTSGQTYTWTPPSCSAPTALTSSSVTTTSATISWNAAIPAPSNGYQYYFSTSSIAPTAGTTPSGSTTGTSVNLTGLTSNVTYYFWVRSNCGGTQSTWTGSSTFYTGTPVCTNTSAYGTATAGTTNAPVTISTCNYQSEYSTVSGIVAGNTYQFGYSLGGWITIRVGTFNGTAVVSGNAPLTWTATSSGTIYVHYNTNSSCGTASICGTSTVTCTSCPAPIAGCTNIFQYITADAPTTSTPLVIATDQWQEEFNQINNVVAGTTFQSSYSLGGFITVRFGTYNGAVVASGNSTLNWTATTSGTYFIHYTLDASCNTATNNGTSTLTCTSCPTPPNNPTSISSSSSFICVGSGNSVTLTANGAVGTVYWFTGSCGTTGQIGTGNSIVVTPTSTTTYFARNFSGGLFSNNCVNTTIELRNPPTVSAGTNPSPICQGNSVILNGSASGSTGLLVSTSGGNGCNGGNMFDITVGATPITLTSFDITPGSTGSQTINVYYKTGTYVGSETTAANWTLLGSYVVNGTTGVLINMPVTNLNLNASTTYGIYINYNAVYSTATTNVNDTYISISAGAGLCGNFSLVNAGRTFNGRVNYQVVPTVSWTPSATLSSSSIVNPSASPTSNTTYTMTSTFLGCQSTSNVTVNVNTVSTSPSISVVPGRVCPNTNITLTASGGVAGTGSSIRWYAGPNGTLGSLAVGSTLVMPFSDSTTVYVRREGTCNNSPDSFRVVTVKQFKTITAVTDNTPNYCTDNNGWNHFYNSSDEIIFSSKGDFSMCGPGFPMVTVNRNPTFSFYNQSQNPTSFCNTGMYPGEMRFEMGRNWNIDLGGAPPSGLYSVRFYHLASEKTTVTNAALDTMNTLTNCGYNYKYNSSNNGWFWFKNTGSNYVAPQWEGTQYDGLISITTNGVTYVEMDSILSFSGGSGGVILIPSTILPITLKSFTGTTDNKYNYLNWVTESEQNSNYFEVERSNDGYDFEGIGLVQAAGNSSTDKFYSLTDINPYIGLNYYRLKSVDLDGSFEYSNIIALELHSNSGIYSFYPNPTDGNLTYSFDEKLKDDLKVEIYDLLGRMIKEFNYETNVGLNNIQIDFSNLSQGVYKVKVLHSKQKVVNTEMIIKK